MHVKCLNQIEMWMEKKVYLSFMLYFTYVTENNEYHDLINNCTFRKIHKSQIYSSGNFHKAHSGDQESEHHQHENAPSCSLPVLACLPPTAMCMKCE